MKYYPIFLDIRDRKCLVVGGGGVGTRKVSTLLECSAIVTVVSSEISENLAYLADQGKIHFKQKYYEASDLEGIFLVIGATNNETVNRQIHSDAERLGKLCNISDRPEVCNFILPSIVNRGDLTIAVSTSGKSPAMAKKIRSELEKKFGNEYAEILQLMGAIREKLLSEAHEPEAHKEIFEQLINSDLLNLIKQNNTMGVHELLRKILGDQFPVEVVWKKKITLSL